MRATYSWRIGVGAAVVWSALTACAVTPAPGDSDVAGGQAPPAESSSNPTAAAKAALMRLDRLEVKGRAPKTGYRRSVFGRAWSDEVAVALGRNGCRTREDILRRDLTDVRLKGHCAVMSGWLDDPYTRERLRFERGVDVRRIQIDHVVALADAWQTGAQQWTPPRRLDFANDPRNLQTTAGWANQRKGSSNAASWLPPNRSYRCTYVARQIEVKAAYGLWVVPPERDAMRRVLSRCADWPSSPDPAPSSRR
ncbi:hypothetical protein GOARA_062_00650 [Gordonia araii NBRC 100433]|uniref:GmrSD restriction endonucleases C-terminal domain-containing protein n=1 Tax=Gordonia araii NBRC 100433 TaxID=1073574 RepID=G7H4M2_9ACTN|nr:HNH endonuclease family protein [Gordonia araii]NNG96146.1 HNH endonuclease [Gordonia araii NBRC 100433]GAB10797.1 hypothetical protein GOARA_062_00650 [Gordonia araii NBRC 100433]